MSPATDIVVISDSYDELLELIQQQGASDE